MDAKAGLDGVREKLREKALANLNNGRSECPLLTVNDAMEVLHAAGVTLPPQPAGPVTFERRLVGDGPDGPFLAANFGQPLLAAGFVGGQRVRVTIEDAATPSTLLTPAEVERRAREWVAQRYAPETEGSAWFVSLVAALTRGA